MTTGYNLNLKEGKDFVMKNNHWLPKKMGVTYFAFGKTLYCVNSESRIPSHEYLHIAQYNKHNIPMVIFHYLQNFIKNYLKSKNPGMAFKEIPFELEAREFEGKIGKYMG